MGTWIRYKVTHWEEARLRRGQRRNERTEGKMRVDEAEESQCTETRRCAILHVCTGTGTSKKRRTVGKEMVRQPAIMYDGRTRELKRTPVRSRTRDDWSWNGYDSQLRWNVEREVFMFEGILDWHGNMPLRSSSGYYGSRAAELWSD